MVDVVKNGTARRLSRKLKSKVKGQLLLGGKTGSITGGMPYGKRDWFVGFAMPKNGKSKGISFAVMHINQKKWYVRSTYIAKNIIDYYYKELNRPDKRVASYWPLGDLVKDQ